MPGTVDLKWPTSPDVVISHAVILRIRRNQSSRSPKVKSVRASTPLPRSVEALSVYLAREGTEAGDWRLANVLVAQLQATHKQWIATTWLDAVAEYGHGAGPDQAIDDLLGSIGEYRSSLEEREAELGPAAIRDLMGLRQLLEPR